MCALWGRNVRQKVRLYPFLTAAHNEVGFYVVPLQVSISFSPCSRLHIVVSIQIVQSGLSDVDASEMRTTYMNPHINGLHLIWTVCL